jgi:hypothetical protein
MAQTLGDNQQVLITVTAKDKAGNVAPVQDMGFGSSDPTILVAVDNHDGSCLVVAQGPLGSATVRVTGDADMGDGVTPIEASLDFDVVAESAVGFNIAVGAPEEKP